MAAIEIIETPTGYAPSHVARCLVGLVIPLVKDERINPAEHPSSLKGIGVNSAEPGNGRDYYWVSADVVVELLAQNNPEASEWARSQIIGRRLFGFEKRFCRLVATDTAT